MRSTRIPGEYPTARQLFTIEQLSSVFALLPSSTAQVVQVRSGAGVSIALAGVPQTMTGKVAAVLDALQPGTTNFTVKVLVPNASGTLRSGMPVTGVVALPAVSGIDIPVTAFIDDTHTSVYTIENGVARTQTVHDVKDDGTHAIVTGLTAGTEIVSDVDSSNVGNGDRVSTGATPAPGRVVRFAQAREINVADPRILTAPHIGLRDDRADADRRHHGVANARRSGAAQ